jgi:hypothetical protein
VEKLWVDKDVDKLETSYKTSGIENDTAAMENTLVAPLKN